MTRLFLTYVPGLIAGAIGGFLGFFLATWVSQFGVVPSAIPGALAGICCGFFSVNPSRIRGVLCAGIAWLAGAVTQWKLFLTPFPTDGSFGDFCAHFFQLSPVPLFVIGLGTFLGYWWGRETTSPWRGRFLQTSTHQPVFADDPIIDG